MASRDLSAAAHDEEDDLEETQTDEETDEVPLTGGLGTHFHNHDAAWKYVQGEIRNNKDRGRPDCEGLVFFDSLKIAKDGGLSEINGTKIVPSPLREPDEDYLWYNSRYFGALLLLVFVVLNVWFIFKQDLATLRKPMLENTNNATEAKDASGTLGHEYLLTSGVIKVGNHALGKLFGKTVQVAPEHVICGVELLIMCLILLRMLFRITQVVGSQLLTVCFKCCVEELTIRKWERARWFAASKLFWDIIPLVSVFSAMKLLFYITPQILALHLNSIIFYQSGNMIPSLLWFAFSRTIACIIGFDSFLVKYRSAKDFIMTDELELMNVLGAVVLLNQILGVVQVSWIIRERLFRFVFGGQDGIMSTEEGVRMDTWNALVAQKIFEKYNCCDRWALALTFCDDDFQRMTLEEDENVADTVKPDVEDSA